MWNRTLNDIQSQFRPVFPLYGLIYLADIFKVRLNAEQSRHKSFFLSSSNRSDVCYFFPRGQRSEECQHTSAASECVCGAQTAGSHQRVCYRVTQARKVTPCQHINALICPGISPQFHFNDSVQCQTSWPRWPSRNGQKVIRLICRCRRLSSQMCPSSLHCSTVSKRFLTSWFPQSLFLSNYSRQCNSFWHIEKGGIQLRSQKKVKPSSDFTYSEVLFQELG